MTMLEVDYDPQMKSAARNLRLAAWSGVLLSLLGLALIGWVLSSLNDLHVKLSAVSPKLATSSAPNSAHRESSYEARSDSLTAG